MSDGFWNNKYLFGFENSKLRHSTPGYWNFTHVYSFGSALNQVYTLNLPQLDSANGAYSTYMLIGNQGGNASYTGISIIGCSGYAGGSYITPICGGSGWMNGSWIELNAVEKTITITAPSTIHFSLIKLM